MIEMTLKEFREKYPNATKAQRDEYGIGCFKKNSAICPSCKDEIESEHRHHFRRCKCGALSVDGGSWYAKRTWDSSKIKHKDIINTSEIWEGCNTPYKGTNER